MCFSPEQERVWRRAVSQPCPAVPRPRRPPGGASAVCPAPRAGAGCGLRVLCVWAAPRVSTAYIGRRARCPHRCPAECCPSRQVAGCRARSGARSAEERCANGTICCRSAGRMSASFFQLLRSKKEVSVPGGSARGCCCAWHRGAGRAGDGNAAGVASALPVTAPGGSPLPLVSFSSSPCLESCPPPPLGLLLFQSIPSSANPT